MKTYRNEQFGFEIDIPDTWSFCETMNMTGQPPGKGRRLNFQCAANENFIILVEPLPGSVLNESPVNQKEKELKQIGEDKGYTEIGLGRFCIEGKEHCWMRYYEGDGHWTKKYIIVIPGTEFTVTASCLDQKQLLQMEKAWDQVANSFRFLPSAKNIFEPGKEEIGQSKTGPTTQGPEIGKMESPIPEYKRIPGMNIYRNVKHGFEMELPETWSPAPDSLVRRSAALLAQIGLPSGRDVFQFGCYDEAINFEIAPIYPEPLLDDTVTEFIVFTEARGYTDVKFGRLNVAGKEHVCASYFINDRLGKRWNKKYMLVFGGIEYALTCTCNDPQWFSKREKDWDAIIRSFHVLGNIDDSINTKAKAEIDRRKRREIVEILKDPAKLYANACRQMALCDYPGAQALLEAFLRKKPDHIQAHKDLAAVLQKMGDIPGAIRQLREVERLDPSDSGNRGQIARLISESGSGGKPG